MVHVITIHMIDFTQLAVTKRHASVQNPSGSGARDLLWCTELLCCSRSHENGLPFSNVCGHLLYPVIDSPQAEIFTQVYLLP